MKNKFLNIFTLLCLSSFFLTSCIKDDVKDLTNEGDTFIKIAESPENSLYFSVFEDVKKVDLFSIRRDAANSGALNSTAAVKLMLDTAKINAYNEENGTDFELLPDSLFTLGEGVTKEGDMYTMNFNSGDFAKGFTINLNGAKWDVSHKYAMAFNIVDSAGLNIKDGTNSVIAFISVKNKYDGVYTVTGTMVDLVNPALTGSYPFEYELVTSGPNSVIAYDNANIGGPGHIISNAGAPSQYGTFGLEITFNPETDAVVSVTNVFAPAANTREAKLDPSGENNWDPATGNINIKYFMLQPSVVPVAPNIRTTFDEQWTYVGPR